MIRRLLHAAIRAFERRYDYDASYLHEFAEHDPAGVWAFTRITRAGDHAGGLPAEALHAARLAAALHEDCGPCAQVVIDIALEAGVDAGVLAALAGGDAEGVPPATLAAFRFAQAVLSDAPGLAAARDAVVRHHGPCGPFCLALALSVARMYPVLKRATGHAHACSVLEVSGVRVRPPAAA